MQRFLDAQQNSYENALSEIRNGRKRSHWIWFIFPQIDLLGKSEMALYYGIHSRQEAQAYLDEPTLGARLRQITEALLALPTNDAVSVFGQTDAKKLLSCMTLFEGISHEPLFTAVRQKFFGERQCEKTLQFLEGSPS